MRRGYRWLTAEGVPCSPLHRTPATAARWLGRQGRSTCPARLLVSEKRSPVRARAYRTPLLLQEAEQLVLNLPALARTPEVARTWVLRAGQRVEARARRRRGTAGLTRTLRG